MPGRPAMARLRFDGRMVIRYEGRGLGFREVAERPRRVQAVQAIRPKPPEFIPPPTHPWKVYREPAEIEDLRGREKREDSRCLDIGRPHLDP